MPQAMTALSKLINSSELFNHSCQYLIYITQHQAHKEGIPLDIFLRRGPIKDGAIKDYSFDEDGAVLGVGFQVIRTESDAQKE